MERMSCLPSSREMGVGVCHRWWDSRCRWSCPHYYCWFHSNLPHETFGCDRQCQHPSGWCDCRSCFLRTSYLWKKNTMAAWAATSLTSARHDVFGKYLAEKISGKLWCGSSRRTGLFWKPKIDRQCGRLSDRRRQLVLSYPSHTRGSKEVVGCTTSWNTRNGTLLRWCTNQSFTLCWKRSCSER